MFGSGSSAFSGGAGNTSGFGQSAFGKPAAPAVFGQQNTSLFNQTTQPSTGLFGAPSATPAFGQTPTAQPSFGGFSAGGSTLFGTQAATAAPSGGLFGQQNSSLVGNSSTGGLFGSSNPNTFGQPKPVGSGFAFGASAAQPTGSIFGAPQTSTAATGMFGSSNPGAFGTTSGFGATSAGGTTIKFNPVTGTDTMVKNGVNQTINTRHQSITVMKEYETKIFEELRVEDYVANRKFGQQGAVSGGGLFGTPKTLFNSPATTSTGLFGANENKTLFGTTTTTPALGGFGTAGTSNVFGAQNSMFGKPQQPTSAFGAQTSQSFGMNTSQPSIFGSNTAQTSKPFGVATPQTNLFGSTPSTFGTQTTGFGQTGFGQPNQNNLFGQNKPAFGLGSTQTTTGFGFGTNTSTSANNLFGSKPTNTGFQMSTPAFGTNNAFGTTSTAQPTSGNLFGSNAFNKGPTTSMFSQPTNQQSGIFNNAAKPGGLFGQGTQGTSLFGSSNTTGFGTSGTSIFGNNPQSSGIGLFGNTNNVQLSTNQASQSNQMQFQLDALKAMPYGDSPLFKRFYKDVSKVDDTSLVRSQNVSLEKFGSYKVSPIPTPKSTPQVRRHFPQFNRKSLFDGLEESPPSFKNRDKINDNSLILSVSSPRSGCKKLNLKKDANDSSKLANGNSMIMHTKPLAKLEFYFSNKQGSPGHLSNKVDLSLNDENNTFAQLQSNKQSDLSTSKGTEANDSFQNTGSDVVTIDNQESTNIPYENHPTGIKLRRAGYYTIPPMDELAELVDENGLCLVDGFTIGRYDYGNVFFPDRFNVAGLDLDSIVHIRHKEIMIYQDDEMKPPLGEGLNRKATVTLDRVWPIDKTTKQPITNPDRIAATNFVVKLQRSCAKLGSKFVDYRSDTGSWVFNVEHFSKYALVDSDDEEDEVKTVDHSLTTKTQPKPTLPKPKVMVPTENISPKQNVVNPLLDLSGGLDRAQSPHQYLPKSNIHTSVANMLSDNSQIIHYYDNNKENSINVTAQLSQNMNVQAHKIQCMKASFDDIFYNEIEPMEEDVYDIEPKDKFEDKLEKILETIPEYTISPKIQDSLSKSKSVITSIDNQVSPKFFISKQKKKVVQVAEVLKTVLPSPLQAQRFTLKYNPSVRLPYKVPLSNTCESSKLQLLNMLSIKVPWSNGLTFVALSTKSKGHLPAKGMDISHLSTELSGRKNDDFSLTVIQKIQIMTPVQTETFTELLTEHLQICMVNSNCDINNHKIPFFYQKFGVDALHSHCNLLFNFPEVPEEEHYGYVWDLMKALWGDPENLYTKDCPEEHLYNMTRRQALSDWLETLLEKTLDLKISDHQFSQKIFKLVLAHKIMEASDLAISNNEFNLAMLLSQIGSEKSVRCCIQRQLWQWFNSKADLFIDIDHLKLYTVISGQPLFDSNQGIVNVCEDLDWIRAFALHLWYIQPPSGTIGDALNAYQNSFEGDDSYSCKPYKTFNDYEVDIDDQFATYDVCYHLLKLYTNSAYEMYNLVNPLTHTRDPLNYNFSWLLFNTLQSLGYTQMSETYANQLHLNFASQLVSHGLWHWAVFVLLHIKDGQLRESLVEDIVGRNVELPVGDIEEICLSEKEKFLVEKLHIREAILYNAKAILAVIHKNYLEAAVCYLKAEQWQEAHNVITVHLLVDFVLQNDRKNALKQLLSWLIEGSTVDGSVPTTMQDSLTILEHLRLSEKLSKMSTENSVKHLVSLCEQLFCFPENTVKERMIKTEISSSIVRQIAHLILSVELKDRSIFNSLVQPLKKLSPSEDYNINNLIRTIL